MERGGNLEAINAILHEDSELESVHALHEPNYKEDESKKEVNRGIEDIKYGICKRHNIHITFISHSEKRIIPLCTKCLPTFPSPDIIPILKFIQLQEKELSQLENFQPDPLLHHLDILGDEISQTFNGKRELVKKYQNLLKEGVGNGMGVGKGNYKEMVRKLKVMKERVDGLYNQQKTLLTRLKEDYYYLHNREYAKCDLTSANHLLLETDSYISQMEDECEIWEEQMEHLERRVKEHREYMEDTKTKHLATCEQLITQLVDSEHTAIEGEVDLPLLVNYFGSEMPVVPTLLGKYQSGGNQEILPNKRVQKLVKYEMKKKKKIEQLKKNISHPEIAYIPVWSSYNASKLQFKPLNAKINTNTNTIITPADINMYFSGLEEIINFGFTYIHNSLEVYFGGGEIFGGRIIQEFMKVNLIKSNIIKLHQMPIPLKSHSFVNIGNEDNLFIILIGGIIEIQIDNNHDRSNNLDIPSERCFEYEISTKKWEEISSLNEGKSDISTCTFNGRMIYSFGGLNSDNTQCKIEKIDYFGDKEWKILNILDWKNTSDIHKKIFSFTYSMAVIQVNEQHLLLFGGRLLHSYYTGTDYNNIGERSGSEYSQKAYLFKIEEMKIEEIEDVGIGDHFSGREVVLFEGFVYAYGFAYAHLYKYDVMNHHFIISNE